MRTLLYFKIALVQVVFSLSATADGTSELLNFRADKEFKPLLEAVPLLLDAGGAKCLKRPDGSLWILSVGTTVVKKPDTPSELMRRRMVALAKARAHAVAELKGTRVTVTSVYTTKDKITIENGVERGSSEEELQEEIITAAKGVIRKMPQVANWMNKTGELYYVAIGRRLK